MSLLRASKKSKYADMTPRAGLDKSFVIFDNASTFQDHLAHVPSGAIVCWQIAISATGQRSNGFWTIAGHCSIANLTISTWSNPTSIIVT